MTDRFRIPGALATDMVSYMTRRTFIQVTVGATAATLLVACGGDTTESGASDNTSGQETSAASGGAPTAQPTTQPGSGDTQGKHGGKLALADQVLPPTLDIHATTNDFLDIIGQQVYQPLVYLDPESKEPVPGLAESWEVSDEGRTWTFKLRHDVTFHDGTPLTSAAFVESWKRLTDPATKSPRASLLGGENLVSFEGPDGYTVVVQHKQPMANFLANIARTAAMAISPKAIEEYGEKLSDHMVGTGPFKLKEYVQADHVTLERWDDFAWAPTFFDHQGPAYLDEFTFRHIPEEGTRIAAFESGELQIARLPWSQFSRFDAEIPGVTVTTISNPGVPGGMFLNSQLAPLDDIRVRKALAHAIDREAIVNSPIFGGAVWVEYGPLTQDMWGYDPATKDVWPSYDVAKAKQLLADAGYAAGADGILEKDGRKLVLTTATSVLSVPFAQVVQAQFKEIGVSLEVTQMDATAALARWEAGQDHIFIGANTSNDPDVLWEVFYSGMRAHADDPRVNELLEKGRITIDPTARKAVYSELQKYLAEQVYSVHVYNSARNYANLDTIRGIRFNDRAGIYLYDIWVES